MRIYFNHIGIIVKDRKGGFRFLLTLAFLLVNIAVAFSAEEPYINAIRGTQVKQGAQFDVTDEKFLSPSTFYGAIKSSPYSLAPENLIELKFNYDTSAYFYDKVFTATVNVTVLCYNNPYDTSQVSSQYNSVNLSVRHDISDATPYKGISFMKFSGAYKFRVIINDITCPELGANMPEVLILEGRTVIKRKYNFTATSTDVTGILETEDQIKLSWNPVNYPGAELFDLEYTVIDDSSAAAVTLRSHINAGTAVPENVMEGMFRNNASRITTSQSVYVFNPVYKAGYLLFRIRGIQFSNEYRTGLSAAEQYLRTEGNWNYKAAKTGNPAYTYNFIALQWHEPELNWQYSIVFAEEGKRKEIMAYYDGILKNRQNVTINNSDNKAIVQETAYDAMGRAAVNILPAPVNDSSIRYFPDFNRNLNGKAYSYQDIGPDASCVTLPEPMANTSGAEKYYSSNNEFNDYFFRKYIPRAEGFPFSVTTFTPDNTGRMASQGGVGIDYQPGTNHESRYYYSKPTSEELDRLFGSEAGNASHYLKNMVVDPNGQISVSYLNAGGKTIATALAGISPANVQPLNSNDGAGKLVTKQLLVPQDFTSDNRTGILLGNSSFLAAVTGNYKFKYSFSPQRLDVLHGSSSEFKICNTCYYDLEVLVRDNCNQVLKTIMQPVGSGIIFQTGCSVYPAQVTDSFNITISTIGEYTVTYSLKVSERALNFYDSLNLVQNTDILPYDSFVLAKLTRADFKDCFSDCATCLEELGSKADFINNKIKPLFAASDSMPFIAAFNDWAGQLYDSLLANCNNIQSACTVTAPCDMEKELMLEDVKPGGQYSPYDSVTYQPTEPVINIMFNYRSTVTFLNVDGSVAMIEINGEYYNANDTVNVPWKIFIENFEDSWAEALLPYHPEYCFYEWCQYDMNYLSKAFDNEIEALEDDSTAVAKGYFGSVNSLLVHDPFFMEGRSGYPYYNAFMDSLTLFSGTVPGYSGPDLDIRQFVDYELYCMPDSIAPADCVAPGANDPCRSRYLEWVLYKEYYLELKAYFNEKARLNNPLFVNCKNCFIGTDFTDLPAGVLPGGSGTATKESEGNIKLDMGINAQPGCDCPESGSFSVSLTSGSCPFGYFEYKVTYSGPDIPAGRTVYVEVYWFNYDDNSYGVETVAFTGNTKTKTQCAGLVMSKQTGSKAKLKPNPNSVSLQIMQSKFDSLNLIKSSGDTGVVSKMMMEPPLPPTPDVDFIIQSVYCYDTPGSSCAPVAPEPYSLCITDPRYPDYKDKVRRYYNYVDASGFYTDMAANYNIYKSDAYARQQSECEDNCEAQADAWINALRKCTPNQAVLANIRAGLIAVCKSACDSAHIFGASTNPALTQSFESVIRSYIPTSSDSCTAELISDPYPYNKQPVTDNRTIVVIDSCLTAKYSQLKNQYLASAYSGSFHEWLQKQLKHDYTLTVRQLDSLDAAITRGCKYLKQPMLLPAALNCSQTAACADSAAVVQTYNAFLTKYPGISSSSEYYEVLLTNYFNHTLGFSLHFDDYQSYISKCQTGTTNKDLLCNVGGEYYGHTNTVTSCMAETFNLAISQAAIEYKQYIDSVRQAFRSSYTGKCLSASPSLILNAKLHEYHYTLYYYDQAGNLIKTIPPEGVQLLTDAEVVQVNNHRLNTNSYCHTGAPELTFNANVFTMNRQTAYDPVINGKYTLELWLKLPTLNLTGPAGVFSYNDRYTVYGVPFESGYSLEVKNSRLFFSVGYSNKLLVESPLLSSMVAANEWFHLVITVNDAAVRPVKMYVNGNEIRLSYLNSNPSLYLPGGNFAQKLNIGSAYVNNITTAITNAGIRQFRWYQRELSVGEIRQNAFNQCLTPASEAALVCYIPVNEGAGTIIRDKITGTQSTLTGNGTTNWQNSYLPVYPKHRLATTYMYNSRNLVVRQSTPDGGITKYWYDKVARLTASQTSEQLLPKNTLNNSSGRYSYTQYDALGRITETGEKYNGTVLAPQDDDVIPLGALEVRKPAELATWYASGTDKQVTMFVYDQANTTLVTNPDVTAYLTGNTRKRLVSSIYKELKPSSGYDYATHYAYDAGGNVKILFQELMALKAVEGSAGKGLRRLDYDYDLISGKVNQVTYQPGQGDQFIYRYAYDADNRITDAYSGRNSLQLHQDAHYVYYLHGPLARTELGRYKVQGVDYAYTLQGWLKGINGQTLDVTKDMAGDGDPAGAIFKRFGRDVYAYSLGYHSNDYKPVGGPAANAFDKTFTPPVAPVGAGGNTGAQLYNGNISYTTSAMSRISNGQTTGYTYLYDQLNRLLGMRTHAIGSTSWSYSSYQSAYEEKLSYDANGNIKTLQRKGANQAGLPLAMDNLKYYYFYTKTNNTRGEYDPTAALPGDVKRLTNQLAHVSDSDPSGSYGEDIDNQSAGNYDYDYTGNLIRDNSEGITGIEWSVYGKIKQINKGSVTIGYGYDALGNRISKEVSGTGGAGDYKDFYIRDAQGNVMAIYRGRTGYVDWSEQVLYGSSRLGIWQYGKARPGAPPSVTYDSMMTGSTTYELTNHLGNVLTTISDKKVGHSSNGATVDYYRAIVLNQTNYYSGGMQMPVRRSDSLLFTNTFDAGTDGWAVYNVGTLQNDNGRLKFTGTVAWSSPKKALTLEEGRQYRIRFTIDMGNCSDLHVPVYKSDISSYVVMDGVGISVTASGSYEGTFTATSNNMLLLIEMIPGVNPPPGSAGYYWIDDVSLERLGPVDSIGVEYRFGFNGQEQDNEIKGNGNQIEFRYRGYDTRLGRFFAVDPVAHRYPYWTPYQFAGNMPIKFVDQEGLQPGERAFRAGLALASPEAYQMELKAHQAQLESMKNVNPMECLHFILDGLGFVPGIGEFADAGNAAIYTAKGDYLNAAFSTISLAPVAGDLAAKGFKYSLKAAGYEGKAFKTLGAAQKWLGNAMKFNSFKVADALQTPRAALQKALGTLGTGKAAHHLVPVEMLEKNKYVQQAVEEGFDFNGVVNGLGLGSDQHSGRHPGSYIKGIEGMIDAARKAMPDASAKEVLENVAGDLKTMLDGTGKKVNELFTK